MNFLLDTNVVSEPLRRVANAGVMDWIERTEQETHFLSVITIAELRRGAARLPQCPRRQQLDSWLKQEIPVSYYGRILAVDEGIAEIWGILMARRDAAGRPLAAMDGFLAATCVVYDLTLVTRNVADFEGSVERIVNPWT